MKFESFNNKPKDDNPLQKQLSIEQLLQLKELGLWEKKTKPLIVMPKTCQCEIQSQ